MTALAAGQATSLQIPVEIQNLEIALQGCDNPVRVFAHVIEVPSATEPAVNELVGATVGVTDDGKSTTATDFSIWRGTPSDGPIRLNAIFSDSDKVQGLRRLSTTSGLAQVQKYFGRTTENVNAIVRPIKLRLYFWVSFLEHWILQRSNKTCYVVLPELSKSATLEMAGWNGETVNGSIVPELSFPHPTRFELDTPFLWNCARTNKCGGFAVFEEPNAEGATATEVLFLGALLGALLSITVTIALEFKLRPGTVQAEPSGPGQSVV